VLNKGHPRNSRFKLRMKERQTPHSQRKSQSSAKLSLHMQAHQCYAFK
jgi:hypothetical protein